MSKTCEERGEKKEEYKPYAYFEQISVQKIHHFYLSDEISADATLYVDMIHRIQTAGPDEAVYMHLNTVGGALNSGIQIINALQQTQAHVICSVESVCHSLGTLIFLCADEFVVHDNCLMLFHTYSGGLYGKSHEQAARLDASLKWFEQLARRFYIPFLNEEETELIFKGQDIWLMSDEIKTRLENMVKVLEKKEKTPKLIKESKTAKKPTNKKNPKKGQS